MFLASVAIRQAPTTNRQKGGPGQQQGSGQPVGFVFLVLIEITRNKRAVLQDAGFCKFVTQDDVRQFVHHHVVAATS